MKIVIARMSGFCMGVRRAVEMVLDAPGRQPEPICTYGPLIHNPQVLLLDEAFSGLDHESRELLERLLGELREDGRTLVLASHDHLLCRRLADRVLEFSSGKLHDARLDNVSPARPLLARSA